MIAHAERISELPELTMAPDSQSTALPWRQILHAGHGHLLQTPAWATVKSRHGWWVDEIRLQRGRGLVAAHVLFKRVGPFSIGYVPRGPVISEATDALLEGFTIELDRLAIRHRALWILVEPNDPIPMLPGFAPSRDRFQPARTVKVPLLPDAQLLGNMHKKTRYNIRLAQRRGVIIREANLDEIDTFYALLRETAERNCFGIHPRSYYVDVLDALGNDAVMLLAEREGVTVAGLIAAKTGDEAIYLYGCSSSESRGQGATAAIQFAAMQWARECGCLRYDLWGIPDHDPETRCTDDGTKQVGSHGNNLTGLYTFKTGFGGEVVCMPDTMEKVYHPVLTGMVRRVVAFRRRG
ncbi:MAG: aminoacyltransferase [Thermomicrobiales bacterium]|nr:aminoacyltransferase [Thermomicrobiales bacterium]